MLENVDLETQSLILQYLIAGMVAIIVTVLGLWLYNRRENRRKHAFELISPRPILYFL